MKSELATDLSKVLPELRLREEVPYRDITTLGVGGALPLLAEPDSEEQLESLLEYTHRNGIAIFIIGGGTNLVGMDDPCPLLGIRLARSKFSSCTTEGDTIQCGAFLRLPELAANAANAGLTGLAKLTGIPGTVGGAIRMNAGAGGSAIGEFVTALRGYKYDGSIWNATKDQLEWSYRSSSIPADVVLVEATLTLARGDKENEGAAIRAELEARRQREPSGRNAGCTFRNVSDLEPAGKLIDQTGFKNYRIGEAAVSEKHANFILNIGNASERDYLELIRQIRSAVAEKHGFYLQPEVRFINPEIKFDDLTPPHVNVLLGGTSSEREVSIRSGNAVATALRNAGFEVEITDLQQCELTDSMRRADVVYPVLHGGFGEDGRLQKVLEDANLCFIGSGSVASDLVMDKIATKRLLDRLGIPTAKWAVITREERELPSQLNLPLILKVPREGSTVGIIKVDTAENWAKAVEEELKLADTILVEEFVKGIEITVPIVNSEVLPAIEIRSPHGFYDWDAKYVYKTGKTQYFCPVESLSADVIERAGKIAKLFYLGAKCRDILRVDFIVSADGTAYMLEGNSLPGCTATSLVPKAARVAGISFERMTSNLVYAALRRHRIELPQEPVPAVTKPGNPANPVLLLICRWLCRILLVICALPLLLVGLQMTQAQMQGGVFLLTAGIFILASEWIQRWLDKAEKK